MIKLNYNKCYLDNLKLYSSIHEVGYNTIIWNLYMNHQEESLYVNLNPDCRFTLNLSTLELALDKLYMDNKH